MLILTLIQASDNQIISITICPTTFWRSSDLWNKASKIKCFNQVAKRSLIKSRTFWTSKMLRVCSIWRICTKEAWYWFRRRMPNCLRICLRRTETATLKPARMSWKMRIRWIRIPRTTQRDWHRWNQLCKDGHRNKSSWNRQIYNFYRDILQWIKMHIERIKRWVELAWLRTWD